MIFCNGEIFDIKDDLDNLFKYQACGYIREFVARPNRYLVYANYPESELDSISNTGFFNRIKSNGIEHVVYYAPVNHTKIIKSDESGGEVESSIEDVVHDPEILVVCERIYNSDPNLPTKLYCNMQFLVSNFDPSSATDKVELGQSKNTLEMFSRRYIFGLFSLTQPEGVNRIKFLFKLDNRVTCSCSDITNV